MDHAESRQRVQVSVSPIVPESKFDFVVNEYVSWSHTKINFKSGFQKSKNKMKQIDTAVY